MQIHCIEVPEVWFCQACESSKYTVSPKSIVKEHVPKVSALNPHGMLQCDAAHSSSPISGRQVCKRQKALENAKVKCIPTEEAIMLLPGTSKKESIPKSKLGLNINPLSMASVSKRIPTGSRTAQPKLSLQKVKTNLSLVPPRPAEPRKYGTVQIRSMIRKHAPQLSKELRENVAAPVKELVREKESKFGLENAEKCDFSHTEVAKGTSLVSCASSMSLNQIGLENIVVPAKEIVPKKQLNIGLKHVLRVDSSRKRAARTGSAPCASSSTSSSIYSSDNFHLDAKPHPRITDVKVKDMPSLLYELEKDLVYFPAKRAIWKGSFKIPDIVGPCDFYDVFRAHPPARALRKAFEFSKQMPQVLHFKLLARCNLWPDIFQGYSPGRDDIALYFFPQDERSRKNYVCLLEHIEMHDLVIRSYMSSVELLLFSSKQLREDCQRLHTEYFLWGVFRSVQENVELHSPASFVQDDHKVYAEEGENFDDMEIDMIGGKNVGKDDIYVPRPKDKLDVPPGFERHTPIFKGGSVLQSPRCCSKQALLANVGKIDKDKMEVPPGFKCRAPIFEVDGAPRSPSDCSKQSVSLNVGKVDIAVPKPKGKLEVPPDFERWTPIFKGGGALQSPRGCSKHAVLAKDDGGNLKKFSGDIKTEVKEFQLDKLEFGLSKPGSKRDRLWQTAQYFK
ncbi:uncharacterized protein LOC131149581 isoform X2 [Malania oleifera]|nr:uncharacterized protein LOC131149581 isoform X2 [Malania oleifera]XP_057956146.1 uncharacterized protein LOC131149581 isoform X2 [Malania oleifera]